MHIHSQIHFSRPLIHFDDSEHQHTISAQSTLTMMGQPSISSPLYFTNTSNTPLERHMNEITRALSIVITFATSVTSPPLNSTSMLPVAVVKDTSTLVFPGKDRDILLPTVPYWMPSGTR
eukprot:m.41377 g.41377  ORF g.41377 m.41377 type:complete len:120 (-) comp10419_c0_seq2:156-515(-)